MSNKNLAIAVLVVAVAVLAYFQFIGSSPKDVLPQEEAVKTALDFINANLLGGVSQASLNGEVVEESGLYKLNIEVEGQSVPSYLSRDGKLLFPQWISLISEKESASAEIVKREKPDLKLFVMSYCPFGLQTQKAILPVMELLSEKADIGIYFVDYIMHGQEESDENLRQYCIGQEQEEKLVDYLSCFVKEGKSEDCLTQADVDSAKLGACVKKTDELFDVSVSFADESTWRGGQFPQFNVQADLNSQYEVQGSPTLVINDQVVNVGRSPEAIKKALCEAFEEAPQECLQELSFETPNPGFGVGTSSDSSSGSCN